MTSTPLLMALAGTLLTQGSVSVRELEVMCNRGIDNPGAETAGVVAAQLQRETGPRASFLRGCQHLAKRDFGKAGAEFERATRESPNEAAFHFWFGRATGEQAQRANVLRQPGLARRTKGEFERAVELDSSYIPAREGLVRYYIAAPGMFGGSIDRAREQAAAITRLNAYRGGLAHANVAIADKDTAALIRAHEELAALFPDSLVPRVSLFNVHAARRDWPAAWRELDAALRLRPSLVTLRYAEGRVAAESGQQLDRGEAALRAYLGHSPAPNEPSLAGAHWRLGMIAAHRGDVAGARKSYETALSVDPKFEPAKAALARLKS